MTTPIDRCIGAWLAAIFGLAIIATVALPASAGAGVYTIYSCQTPSGPTPGDEWRTRALTMSVNTSRNDCANRPLELRMLPTKKHKANDYVATRLSAPADTDIEGYRLWRTVRLAKPYSYYHQEITSADRFVEIEACSDSCTAKGGAPGLGNDNLVQRSGLLDVHGIDFKLTCGLSDSSGETCEAIDPAGLFRLYRADVTFRDQLAPAFTAPPSGPLVEPPADDQPVDPLAGSQEVTVSAADRGSGVYQLHFEVDGTIVQSEIIDDNGGRCRQPFTRTVPCMLGTSGTVALDTTRLADGAHTLRLLVTDATETNAAAWGPITIHTANASCNPTPRVETLDMKAGVTRRRGKRRRLHTKVTTASRGRVRLRGRLRTPQGQPVAGAAVCVAERTSVAGAPMRTRDSLVTDAKGRFSYVVRRGPSRRIYFVHRTGAGAVTATVRYGVRASVRLKGSRGSLRTGQVLGLRGRLRGRPIPRKGVLVELQARTSKGWQTFRTVQTNRRGRFKTGYRFTRTRGVHRYRLRARVPSQPTYAYATGKSKPVQVVVRG